MYQSKINLVEGKTRISFKYTNILLSVQQNFVGNGGRGRIDYNQ